MVSSAMGEISGGGGNEHTALVDGKLLSGEAILEHARNKGLCHKCLQTVTHRRIRKKFGISRGWEPITITDTVAGNYTVYKGYCLQPTCWTLEEAQIILGEKKAKKSKASRRTTGISQQNRRTSRRPRASICVPVSSSNSLGAESSNSGTLRKAHTMGDDESITERRSPARSRSREEKNPGLYQLPYIDETRLIEDSARRFGNTVGGPSFASRNSGASMVSEYSSRTEDATRKSKALELGTLLDAQNEIGHRIHSASVSDTNSFRSSDGIDEGRMRKKRASVAVPMRKKPIDQSSTGSANRRRISVHAGFETKKLPSPLLSSSSHSRSSIRRHSGSCSVDGVSPSSTPTILELIQQNGLDTLGSGSHHHPSHGSGSQKHPSRGSGSQLYPSRGSGSQLYSSRGSGSHQCPKPPIVREARSVGRTFDSSNQSLQYQNLRCSNHGEGRKLVYSSADELPNVSNHSSESARSIASSSQENGRSNAGFGRSDTVARKKQILAELTEVHATEPFDSGKAQGLWASLDQLYRRSPGLNPKLSTLKTLLYILEQEDSSGETYKLGWELLAQVMVSPQEVLTDYNMAQNLFRAILMAYDLEIDSGGSEILQSATRALFALFELHGSVAASVVASMISVLDRSKRLQWSAALLDNLLTADTESDFFAQALLVISKLLSLRANGTDSGMISPEEEMMMLTMLVGFVVSVLSGYEKDCASLDRYDAMKSKSAINLLSYISSRAGVSAISDRHYECIEVVCETIGRNLENDELVREGSIALSSLQNLLVRGDSVDSEGSRETKNAVMLLEKLLFEESGNVDSKSLTVQLLGILQHSYDDERQISQLANSGIPKQLMKMLGDSVLSESASALAVVVAKHDPANFQQDPEILPTLISALAHQGILPETKANVCKIMADLVVSQQEWLESDSTIVHSLSQIFDTEEEPVALLQEALHALSKIVAVLPNEHFLQQRSTLMHAAIAFVRSNENPQRVAIGFDLLDCLLLRSEKGDDITPEVVITVTITSMEQHFCSIEVVTACCRVLRKFVEREENCSVIARTGVARLIINAIMIYPTSKEFLLEAMAILEIFASKKNFRATFDDAEAEAALTSLLAASQYKPDVLAMAFGTLDSIVRYSPAPSKAPPIQAVVLNCIVMALKTYPGNENVSLHSFKLLQTYSYSEESLVLMREQSAALVPILSNSHGLSRDTCEKAQFIMCRLYNQYNGFAARRSRSGSSQA